jgi:hypothetical protein
VTTLTTDLVSKVTDPILGFVSHTPETNIGHAVRTQFFSQKGQDLKESEEIQLGTILGTVGILNRLRPVG